MDTSHDLRKQTLLILTVILMLTVSVAYTQRRGGGRGDAALAEPFRGITAGGEVEAGLFKIAQTGVSTEPVVAAAEAYLASLDDEQRDQTMFPVDDLEWRQWDNRHSPPRQGVSFKEMSSEQREAAFGLMRASLSAKGLTLSQDIMKLNETLAELADNFDEYGQWLYWITMMGEPSATEPWGWQVDGHHLVINYFVLGDQVVMSPLFIGSEPVKATSGKFAGTVILQEEQDQGLALVRSLRPEQQQVAILSGDKPGNNALTQAYEDNVDLDYAGIAGSQLNEAQRSLLLEVIGQYVGNLRDGHARVKMDEVKTHLDRTHFAWIGGTGDEDVFYYRIHSPVILIEFDHQRRVAPFRSSEPSKDHIHAVVRTPNGNDYGKDLLRQHYEEHPHHADEQK